MTRLIVDVDDIPPQTRARVLMWAASQARDTFPPDWDRDIEIREVARLWLLTLAMSERGDDVAD